MIDVVKRGIAVVAMLALIAEPGSCDGAKKAAPAQPPAVAPGAPVKKYPCQRSSQAIIVQYWTIGSEPITIRLSAFDDDGVPLIGNNGKPIVDHVDTVVTTWPDEKGIHVYEFPLCFKKTLTGYAWMEGGRKVKMGIRYVRLSLAMTRTEGPEEKFQGQIGQGIVSSNYHFQATTK